MLGTGGLVVVMVLAGCGDKCEDQAAPAACPEGQVCKAIDDPVKPSGPPLLGIMNFPFGPGPTEIKKGPKIVGVAYRQGGQEDVYMFKAPVTPGPNPCSMGAPIEPYPAYLSPFDAPTGAGSDTLHSEPMYRCDANCNCDPCTETSCYANAAAFADPAAGVWADLDQQLDLQHLQPPVSTYSTSHAAAYGTMTPFTGFTSASCASWPPVNGAPQWHADQAIDSYDSTAAWELVGFGNVVQGKHQQVEYVVMRVGYSYVWPMTQGDATVPPDVIGNPNGPADDWCALVAQSCPLNGQGQPTCRQMTVTFTD